MVQKNAIIVKASELASIKDQLNDTTAETLARDRALKLHELSKSRTSKWDNTVAGGYKKKKEARAKRLADKEAKLVEQDEAEAALQMEQRKNKIMEANKKLYQESDRMKTFNSKMMLADVLHERASQVQLAHSLKKLEQLREQRYLEMDKQNYRKMLERELNESHQLETKNKEIADIQKQQLAEQRARKMREAEAAILEGELIRKKAEEDAEAEKLAEMERKQQKIVALVETQTANQYLKKVKEEDLKRAAREEARIAEYAAHKEHMANLRKKREKEVFDNKQAIRQRQIDKQAALLASKANKEEAKLEQELRDAEASSRAIEAAKKAKTAKWIAEVELDRQYAIAAKMEMATIAMQEEKVALAKLAELNEEINQREKQDQLKRFLAARKLNQDQLKQAELQRRKREQDRLQQLEIVAHAKQAEEADALEFHAYAEKCIRQYAEEGKNVIPMIQELQARKRDFA